MPQSWGKGLGVLGLEEIKISNFKGNAEMRLQDDVPTGLGLEVSLPNKKVKTNLEQNESFEQDNV